ncbi:MAG TPA: helix-turn-helix domain-containing protein [Myxococcota bacterium]|nr:helix-turn-helix domain-containing protein [Myxococcota bacterium]
MAQPRPTPPRRRRSDFDQNRQRLLASARKIVAERGPEALTVSEVAHRAGLNRTTAYQHFRTRDALASAVLEVMGDELQARLQEQRPAPELIDGMIQALTLQPEIARLALHLMLAGDPLPQRAWERAVAHITRSVRGPHAQVGVDGEMLAHVLVGTSLVWSLRARAEYEESEVPAATARLVRELKRLLLYGLFRPERVPDLVDSLRPRRARKKEGR